MIYSPHVQSFYFALNDAREQRYKNLQDYVLAYSSLIKAQRSFKLGVGELWYSLKPKKQANTLELILSELDSFRIFDLTDPMHDISDNKFENIKELPFLLHTTYQIYLDDGNFDNHFNKELLSKQLSNEKSSFLLDYIRFETYRDLYNDTHIKYINLVGIEIAAKWIFDTYERELAVKYLESNPRLVEQESYVSNNSKLTIPPLQWKGSMVELVALFVELQVKGYIDLPSPTNYDSPSWERICRGITDLFSLTTRRITSKGEPWTTLATYFKTKEYTRNSEEVAYGKIENARKKFTGILLRIMTLDGS